MSGLAFVSEEDGVQFLNTPRRVCSTANGERADNKCPGFLLFVFFFLFASAFDDGVGLLVETCDILDKFRLTLVCSWVA